MNQPGLEYALDSCETSVGRSWFVCRSGISPCVDVCRTRWSVYLLVIRQMDSACVCRLFSRTMPHSSVLHFPKSGIWFFNSLLRLEVPPFLLFLFYLYISLQNTQSCCEVSPRSWKVLFKPEVFFFFFLFSVLAFQLARWISVGQSVERKGFWKDFWRPTSSSCLCLLQFPPHNWLSRVAAKKAQYQMQTEKSQSFNIHQWEPLWSCCCCSASAFHHVWKRRNCCIGIRAADRKFMFGARADGWWHYYVTQSRFEF